MPERKPDILEKREIQNRRFKHIVPGHHWDVRQICIIQLGQHLRQRPCGLQVTDGELGDEMDDGDKVRHAETPELAREALVDSVVLIFKSQVEVAFREQTAGHNALLLFVHLVLQMMEEQLQNSSRELAAKQAEVTICPHLIGPASISLHVSPAHVSSAALMFIMRETSFYLHPHSLRGGWVRCVQSVLDIHIMLPLLL